MEDNLVWLNIKSNSIVKFFYSYLSNGRAELFPFGTVWNSWVLLRISFFESKAMWGSILTLDQLKKERLEDPK